MGQTKISWADHTFNPWIGCHKIAAGCKFCYAETFANRYMNVQWGEKTKRVFPTTTWKAVVALNKKAIKEQRRYSVFCASLADIFEDHPDVVEVRKRFFDELVERCIYLDFILLTKRPENIVKLMPEKWKTNRFIPSNVWMLVSCSTQKDFDANWPVLKAVKSGYSLNVAGVSFEPLLEQINMKGDIPDWVIVGGESGYAKDARPMEMRWVYSIRSQMESFSPKSAFFFKQYGTQLARKLKIWKESPSGENIDLIPMHQDVKLRELPFQKREKPEITNNQQSLF